MRRGFILITLSVLLICLLAGTQSAAAQLLAGVQLSYGWANYADILGKGSARASQLLTSVWGQYDHEDLRLLFKNKAKELMSVLETGDIQVFMDTLESLEPEVPEKKRKLFNKLLRQCRKYPRCV